MFNVSQQWAAVGAAPALYITAILVVIGLAWAFIHFFYRQRMEWKDDQITALQNEADRLKLDGSPAAEPAEPSPQLPPSRNWHKNMISIGRDLAVRYTNFPEPKRESFRHFLEGSSLYPHLRSYLSRDYRDALEAPWTVFASKEGAKYEALVEMFLDELDRLEQEWGLR